MKKVIYFAVIITAVAFASCEEFNDIENTSKTKIETSKYVFSNPQWELVDAQFVDEYGYVGKLYKNVNNPNQQRFDIEYKTGLAKACPGATGTYSCTTDENGNITSEKCEGKVDNCFFRCKEDVCTLIKLECPNYLDADDIK